MAAADLSLSASTACSESIIPGRMEIEALSLLKSSSKRPEGTSQVKLRMG